MPQEEQTNRCTFIGFLVFAPPIHSLAGFVLSFPHLGHFANLFGKRGLPLTSLVCPFTTMMKPPRPTGVALLAILDLLFGILALLGGIFIAAIGGSGLLTLYGYGFFSGFVAVAGGFVIIIGILAIVVGWGMWSGKEWAWLLAIILYGLGALTGLLSLAGGNLSSVVGLLIDALLLWYLFRPHVKAFFGRGTGAQPAPMMQSAPPTTA